MRRKLIAGNWKMNKTSSQTREMLKELVGMQLSDGVDCLICPPFTSLESASLILGDTNISLGAQNVSEYENGARTGEISTDMLSDIGVSHIIIGHSERRMYYGETDDVVNRKVKRAINEGFKVILCVGEQEYDREKNIHEEVVYNQLLNSLQGIDFCENIIIAYEPVWAIGTGKTCGSMDADLMCHFIRKTMAKIFSAEEAENIRILYGGSVKPSNIRELMSKEDIDGALVGGASLKAEDFRDLINFGD